MKEIKKYLRRELKNRLKKYKLSEEIISDISEDINKRLLSVLSEWNNTTFVNSILFLGQEEAIFYEPSSVDLKVRSLVVVCVRNSLLEDLTSSKPTYFVNHKNLIKDTQIQSFTKDAINYFKDIKFEILTYNNDFIDENIFLKLRHRYPIAWQALSTLANSDAQEISYKPLSTNGLVDSNTIETIELISAKEMVEVQSGIDPKISSALSKLLKGIKEREIAFLFTDCFKFLTRNPEKLLKIVDFTLKEDAAFITSNYYISNGYVSRRAKLLRPAHSTQEVEIKLNILDGLSEKHKEVLLLLKNNFK